MATKKQSNWEGMMEDWFLKLPPLSKHIQQTIVTIIPWIALIFGILGILGLLAGFGVLTIFAPFILFTAGLGGLERSVFGILFGFIATILLLAAYPGTKARKHQGWKLLFWSELCNALAAVFSFSLSGVLVALVGFYFLYQIKSYYK